MDVSNLDLNEVLSCVHEEITYYEEWRDVKDYEGLYMVSSFGRVKGMDRYVETKNPKFLRFIKGVVFRPGANPKGRLCVILTKDRKRKTRKVHQLVAESFLNHTPCGYDLVVNHINFDHKDNRVINLELISARENSNQKHLKSVSKYTGVCWVKRRSKWIASIIHNRSRVHLGYFEDEKVAAQYYEDALHSINNNLPIKTNLKVYTSKYKGVSWNNKDKMWRSLFYNSGKSYHVGRYDCELEAHKAHEKYKEEFLSKQP